MKRYVLIFIPAVFILACSDKNKLPAGVMAGPKMQAVMWDMIRAGDFLNNYVFYKDANIDKTAESQKWNEKIFQMHKITRSEFDISYAYYQQHPQLMKVIMDSISKMKVEQPPAPAGKDIFKDAAKNNSDSVKKRNIDSTAWLKKLNRMRNLSEKGLK